MLITAIVLTPKIFTLLHNDFVLFLFEIIILGFFTLLVTFLRKRKGFTHSLIGAIILLSCLVIQVVKYTLLVEPHYFSFLWGYMILFFLQSVTISQQVAVRWKHRRCWSCDAREIGFSQHHVTLNTRADECDNWSNPSPDRWTAKERSDWNSQKLQFSSENLLKLINDILDYSKMESRKPELEDSIFNLKNIGEKSNCGPAITGSRKTDLNTFELW